MTYMKSPIRGQFYYLYLVVDVWSRKIVGWAVEEVESSELAAILIQEAAFREGIDAKVLVLHSDNGGPMKGATMLATLQWLGIVPSFSRPRVADDNAYSEALFRTVKYRPEYPSGAFGSLEEAREWVQSFVRWYNQEHRHSGVEARAELPLVLALLLVGFPTKWTSYPLNLTSFSFPHYFKEQQ